MYLLFNDLIYPLICEKRGTIPTKRTAPLSLFRQFYKYKGNTYAWIIQAFLRYFLSQLPLQSFSGPLETHYTYQIDSQREIVLEETPSFPARYSWEMPFSRRFSLKIWSNFLYSQSYKRIRAWATHIMQVCAPNARGLASDATWCYVGLQWDQHKIGTGQVFSS